MGKPFGSLLVAIATASLALAAGSARAAAPAGSTGVPPRLNVVFIVSDDERVDGTRVMHDVQRLIARHGITFTNFDVTTSECGPSRASILTGQYSHHTGVTDNFGPHGYPAFRGASDLAEWLHRDGYRTALVGKYLNDYSLDGHGEVPPGWDDWQAMDSVPLEKYYDYKLNENGRMAFFGHKPSDYSTTVLTNRALSFLRTARRPFFLYFAPVAPHLPAIPAPQDVGTPIGGPAFDPPSLNQANISGYPWAAFHSRSLDQAGVTYTKAVRRHQLQSLLSLDRSVKQIVDTLAQRHELDRTVIFYTSDNGFLWGEHRLGGKLWPYRESTHVPLIVRTPWTTANGTVNNEPILNIDFASTISQLAGIRPGAPQDGDSFMPMLFGKSMRWRRDYLIEYLGQNKLRDGGPPPYVAIRTPEWLYVRYRYRGWQELYNVERDPWQLHNLAGRPGSATTIAALRTRLDRMYAARPHRDVT